MNRISTDRIRIATSPRCSIDRANDEPAHAPLLTRSLFLLPLVLCLSVAAQSDLPALPRSGSTWDAFIPERWVAMDTAVGDLNNDQVDDVAFVLQCLDSLEGDTTGRTGWSPVPPRKLVVLLAMPDGYRLVQDNDRFILRADEGGWFDPYEGMAIADGLLVIRFYGGSAWRYSRSYSFRYGRGGFHLVAAETADYHATSGEGAAYRIDFINHRMEVTTGNITEEEETNETTVKELPPDGLRSFSTFARPFTWMIDGELDL